MSEEMVLFGDLADELGMDKSNARKYILRLGYQFLKARDPKSRQIVLALTPQDATAIKDHRARQGFPLGGKRGDGAVVVENNWGYFYVVQLLPEALPGRIKMGYSVDPKSRLIEYRNIAPSARIVQTWKCKSTWERAAMASMSQGNCKHMGGEVYDCENIDALIKRGDAFFALMPASG